MSYESKKPRVEEIHAVGGYGYSAGLYGDFTFQDSITAPNVTVSTLLTATQFTDGFSEIGSGSADFAGNVTIVGTVSASNLSGTNTGDQVGDGVTITGAGTGGDPFVAVGGGTGDVVGPGSATDNAITRFDSTTGKLVQNSSATVDDSGYLTSNAYIAGSSYVNAQTGTTYTNVAGDNGRIITCSNASAITFTVTDSGMDADYMITVYQLGAGQVSFTAGGTAVLRNVSSQTKIAGQYGAVTIKRVGSGTDFIISGSTGA